MTARFLLVMEQPAAHVLANVKKGDAGTDDRMLRHGRHAVGLLATMAFCAALLGCSDPAPEERIRMLVQQGDLAQAQRAARAHLVRVEGASSTEPLAIAAALDLLTETLWEGEPRDLREGLAAARRSLEIKKQHAPRDSRAEVTSLFNIGVVLLGLGDYRESRRLLQEVAVARRADTGGSQSALADVLVVLANAETQLGDYRSASLHFEETLQILSATRDENDLDLAFARAMYGNLLAQTGDYDTAISLHEQALDARRRSHGDLHPRVAGSLNNLGAMHLAAGHLDLALKCMREALAIREKTLGAGHPFVASTRSNVSAVLDAMGRHAEADALLERSVAELAKALGPDHPDVAEQIEGQALRASRNGDLPRAIELYARALHIRERALGSAHPEVAATLVALAPLVAGTGDTRGALEMSLRAEEIGRELQTMTSQVLSERQALRFAEIRTSGLDLAIALAASSGDVDTITRVWTALIRARAQVFDEMVARHGLAPHRDDPRLAEAWAELVSARQELATITIEGLRGQGSESPRSRLDEAHQKHERAERRLARESTAFRAAREQSLWGLLEVSRGLTPATALLAYVLHQDPLTQQQRYSAFLLTRPGASPRLITLGSAEEIDALVGRYRETIRDPRRADDWQPVAKALRARIWDPLRAALSPDTRLLLVVPDGALHLVNLATLPVGKSNYLVETGPTVHNLAAERDLLIDPEGPRGRGLLALGNPTTDGARTASTDGSALREGVAACSSLAGSSFPELPGATREVAEILAMWRPFDSGEALGLLGAEASESAFKIGAPGKRVLHLATHGLYLDGACVERQLGLRGIAGLSSSSQTPPETSPDRGSVFSGVVLAAPLPSDGEDGILTAEEIAALDLSGVEWAVVSACESGIGPVQAGEGLLGLRRAFAVAGASTLITSLWPVQDDATLEWMRLLYGGRLEGRTTAEAVHHATLQALRARRQTGKSTHPFYWGGFVGAGNWR